MSQHLRLTTHDLRLSLTHAPQKLVSSIPRATSPRSRHHDADGAGDDRRGERRLAAGLAVELDRLHGVALDPDLPPPGVADVGVEPLDVRRRPEDVPYRPHALAEPVGPD